MFTRSELEIKTIKELRDLCRRSDFSRDLENLSLNLSPTRRETLNLPSSLVGKGVRGLGQSLAFLHDVKSQVVDTASNQLVMQDTKPRIS
jgi:hypothetical protein